MKLRQSMPKATGAACTVLPPKAIAPFLVLTDALILGDPLISVGLSFHIRKVNWGCC